MRSVEFVPFLLTDQADIFTIRINGDSNTELEKFLVMFKDSENKYIQRDLESILKAISISPKTEPWNRTSARKVLSMTDWLPSPFMSCQETVKKKERFAYMASGFQIVC